VKSTGGLCCIDDQDMLASAAHLGQWLALALEFSFLGAGLQPNTSSIPGLVGFFAPGYLGYDKPAKFTLIDNHRVIATKAKIIDLVHGRIYQQTELRLKRVGDGSLDVAALVREYIHAIHCFQSWILASETLEDFTLDKSEDLEELVGVIFCGYKHLGRDERRRRLIQLLWISAYDPGSIHSMFHEWIKDSRAVKESGFLSTPDFANLLHLPDSRGTATRSH
jgi:hypothetical protein